ncbi:MAG: shikimate dehydrogenase [Paracoccaceae bacterium]|jgi:shikimate dehydrogenase
MKHALDSAGDSAGNPHGNPHGDSQADSIGAGPLVVSLLCHTLDGFRQALTLGAAADADVVELRLDHVAHELVGDSSAASVEDGTARLAELIQLAARPTIAAVHGSEGFGAYRGSTSDRGNLLELAARAGAAFLDIDASLIAEAALEHVATPRILSTHRELPAIDVASLDAVAAELDALVRPGSGDLIKIVPAAERAEEVLPLLSWLERRPGGTTIAFASGQVAAFSRMAAPGFGSVFVYAAPARIEEPDPEHPLLQSAAPGQLRVPHIRAAWGGPGRAPGRATRFAAICGRPIGHSATPVTHGAALRVLGGDGLFLPVAPTSFTRFVEAVRTHPRWVGFSVTAPFKLEAAEVARGPFGAGSDRATAAIGAANTLTLIEHETVHKAVQYGDAEGPRLAASNTDAPAVGDAVAEALGREQFDGLSAVVIGAGGAARAATFALARRGAAVTVAARRFGAADALAKALTASGGTDSGPTSIGPPISAVDLGSDAYRQLRPDIIVHTTPLGTDGIGEPDVPAEHLCPGVAVLDAVYRPRETRLLRRTAEAGGLPISGERWFLLQGWRQHVAIFQCLYGASAPEGDAAKAAQDAMAEALQLWLAGTTSTQTL